MQPTIGQEIAALKRMSMISLRARYAEVFGDSTNANNRTWLVKRIAWRLQAKAEGDLSERAQRRAEELADDADLRLSPPKSRTEFAETLAAPKIEGALAADGRLPKPGALLVRKYKGQDVLVKVLDQGFEFEGKTFKSLSAVARAITGSHVNGFHFFKLKGGDA